VEVRSPLVGRQEQLNDGPVPLVLPLHYVVRAIFPGDVRDAQTSLMLLVALTLTVTSDPIIQLGHVGHQMPLVLDKVRVSTCV